MRFGVMGSGAIGSYLGGKLLASGTECILVGRKSLADEVARGGMRLTDFTGADQRVEKISIATSPEALSDCDVVLVTVKSGDTEGTAKLLSTILRADTVVVSFQNGVSNADVLRARLNGRTVLAGMVPFNVLRRDGAHFHRGTSGNLAIERSPHATPIAAALERAGLPVRLRADMNRVLWGKLLVNLNNPINALAGIPIKEMLAIRDYRTVMAACVNEALDVLDAAGIKPVLDFPIPARWVPKLMTLPDRVFAIAARPMIRIDPQARSSMWDDLERGRKTEIDALNGEVVRLAARVGCAAPLNTAMIRIVRAAEGSRSPRLSASDLRSQLGM